MSARFVVGDRVQARMPLNRTWVSAEVEQIAEELSVDGLPIYLVAMTGLSTVGGRVQKQWTSNVRSAR